MKFVIFIIALLLHQGYAQGNDSQIYEIIIPTNLFRFEPDKLTIHTGDTVRWQNKDERKHVLASIPGSGPTDELEIFSDELRPGSSYSHQFTEPGEYPFFCFIHNKMTGLIVVKGKEK